MNPMSISDVEFKLPWEFDFYVPILLLGVHKKMYLQFNSDNIVLPIWIVLRFVFLWFLFLLLSLSLL